MVLKIKSENKWSRMNVGRQFRTHFLVFLKMTIIAIHKFGNNIVWGEKEFIAYSNRIITIISSMIHMIIFSSWFYIQMKIHILFMIDDQLYIKLDFFII